MQVWVDHEVANLVALFLQAVVHVFVVVAVHYVVAHSVVVEQVVYLAGPAQFQVPVCGVLPAVVVFVVAAVNMVDGVVAAFVEVVVILADIVVVIVAVVAGSIAVVAPVEFVVPTLVLVASVVPTESNERNMGVAWA